jgi:hypothetical protein
MTRSLLLLAVLVVTMASARVLLEYGDDSVQPILTEQIHE